MKDLKLTIAGFFFINILINCGANDQSGTNKNADQKTDIEHKKRLQKEKEEQAEKEKAEKKRKEKKIDLLVKKFTNLINIWDAQLDTFNKVYSTVIQEWPALEGRDLSGMTKEQAVEFLIEILDLYIPLSKAYEDIFGTRSSMGTIISELYLMGSDKAVELSNLKKPKNIDILGKDAEGKYKSLDDRISPKMKDVIELAK